MVALTGPRNTPRSQGGVRSIPLLANAKVFAGAMVQIAASTFGVAAAAVAANVTVGRAEETVDNTGGANGAKRVKVRTGIFNYANSAGGDLVTRAHIGKPVYVVDDQTVAATDNAGARPRAGTCFDLDASGVWVQFS